MIKDTMRSAEEIAADLMKKHGLKPEELALGNAYTQRLMDSMKIHFTEETKQIMNNDLLPKIRK